MYSNKAASKFPIQSSYIFLVKQKTSKVHCGRHPPARCWEPPANKSVSHIGLHRPHCSKLFQLASYLCLPSALPQIQQRQLGLTTLIRDPSIHHVNQIWLALLISFSTQTYVSSMAVHGGLHVSVSFASLFIYLYVVSGHSKHLWKKTDRQWW